MGRPNVTCMTLTRRLRTPLLALAASALLLPAVVIAPVAQAAPAPPTATTSSTTAAAEPTSRKAKAPKGMPDQRLRKLIEQHLRGTTQRECERNPNCTATYKWSKIQWRGSARHCIAGENYGSCARWATAFVARADLLISEVTSPDYSGKRRISMTQLGYWNNGLKRVTFTDDYGPGEAWCSLAMGCGSTLLVWQDEFKDWFYSFLNIGECCGGTRLT